MYNDGFPCTGCGGCCRLIGELLRDPPGSDIPMYKYAIESFPYKADENGVCEKLVDNRCSVYEDRPLLCNVTALGTLLRKNMKDWYSENVKYCNWIIDRLGIDKSYKIPEYPLK
jgi:Fe-S-cluster containining protein